MKTMKALLLASAAALSIGIGTAMAQSETPSDPGNDYWTLQRQADARRTAGIDDQVQYGSSDVDRTHARSQWTNPSAGNDYSTNPD